MNLQPFIAVHLGQDPAHCRMLDLRDFFDQLDAGINDFCLVLEERRQPAHADVAIFVDSGPDPRPPALAKPRRIIGAAAEQRDAKRGAADNHARRLPTLALMTCSARLSDSGVPISMNANRPANASSEPAGARAKTSCSSDTALPA